MITEDLLYCMAMESEAAYRLMPELCARLGYPFPPRLTPPDTAKRDALPDPLQKGEPAPVTLAFFKEIKMAATKDSDLTAEKVRSVLRYEPETGLLTWRKQVAKNIKSGATINPMRNHGNYVQIQIDKKLYYMHQLAWMHFYGASPVGSIDHIDGDKTNNRISNLRDVSVSVNAQNQKRPMSNNKSGFLGVNAVGQRFRAQINVDGAQRYLGTFDTPEAAHAVYISEKRKLHAGCTI